MIDSSKLKGSKFKIMFSLPNIDRLIRLFSWYDCGLWNQTYIICYIPQQPFVYKSVLVSGLKFNCMVGDFLCPWHWVHIDLPMFFFSKLCAKFWDAFLGKKVFWSVKGFKEIVLKRYCLFQWLFMKLFKIGICMWSPKDRLY